MNRCKGCPSSSGCDYKEYSDICPCIKCLVKVTCRIACDELHDFLESVYLLDKTRKIKNLNLKTHLEYLGVVLKEVK